MTIVQKTRRYPRNPFLVRQLHAGGKAVFFHTEHPLAYRIKSIDDDRMNDYF